MLKALKWAYDIGIRQERVRIAGHLRVATTELYKHSSEMSRLLGIDEAADMAKDKLAFELAVDEKVQRLINYIMDPNEVVTYQGSIMFPNDNHKTSKE